MQSIQTGLILVPFSSCGGGDALSAVTKFDCAERVARLFMVSSLMLLQPTGWSLWQTRTDLERTRCMDRHPMGCNALQQPSRPHPTNDCSQNTGLGGNVVARRVASRRCRCCCWFVLLVVVVVVVFLVGKPYLDRVTALCLFIDTVFMVGRQQESVVGRRRKRICRRRHWWWGPPKIRHGMNDSVGCHSIGIGFVQQTALDFDLVFHLEHRDSLSQETCLELCRVL